MSRRYHVAVPVLVTEIQGPDIEPAKDEPMRAAMLVKIAILADSPEHAVQQFWERIDGAFGDP